MTIHPNGGIGCAKQPLRFKGTTHTRIDAMDFLCFLEIVLRLGRDYVRMILCIERPNGVFPDTWPDSGAPRNHLRKSFDGNR